MTKFFLLLALFLPVICFADTSEDLGSGISQTEKGAPGGVATLDGTGKVPLAQIPGGGGGTAAWGGITGTLTDQSDLVSALNGKQNSLGFTPENVANKDTDGTLSADSDTKYSSQKAVKTYADTKQPLFTPGAISTTTSGLHIVGGSSSTVGPSVTVNVDAADDSQPGLLTAADHVSFSQRLRYLGAWDNAVNYVINDEVTYVGIIYVCIANNHSGEPDQQPTLWVPSYTVGFPLYAPESLAGAPTYAFNETGTDTGFGSPSDGVIEVSNNGGLSATFDANHNLAVIGTISASNYPFVGNPYSIAGYDASGNQITVPGWSYSINNGMNLYSATPVPADAGVVFNSENNHNLDITLPQSTAQYNTVGFTWNSSFDPANSGNNFTGEYFATTVNDEVQGSGTFGQHHASRIDQDLGNNSAGTFGDSGVTQEHSHIYPSVTVNSFDYDYHSLENDGTVTNNSRMIWFDISGAGHLKDMTPLMGGELNSTLHVDHDLQFLSFYNSAAVGHNFGAINIGNDGAIAGDMSFLNIGNNTGGGGGGGTIGGNLSLFNFYNEANTIAGDFQGGTLSNQGDVGGTQTGLNINLSGAAPGGATGINIDMHSIVSNQQLRGINIDGGDLNVQANLDTSVQTVSGEFQENDLGGTFTVASGHPVSSTFGFGNNLGISTFFEDNMGPDGTGDGLGYSVNGFVNQVSAASGKTVDYFNYMTAGGEVPVQAGDGGTITNFNYFNALGLLSAGGNLSIGTTAGYRASPILCSFSSNCYGVFIEDATARNYFAGDIELDKEIVAKQISTPATPVASHNKLYFKSDNHLYMKNSSGTETQVDGGSGSGFARVSNTVSADTTVSSLSTDNILNVDSSSGALNITLPDATASANWCIDIKNIGSPVHTVSLLGASGQTVDGGANFDLTDPNESAHLCSVGGNWFNY